MRKVEKILPHLKSDSKEELFSKLKRHVQYHNKLSKSPEKYKCRYNSDKVTTLEIVQGGLGPGAISDVFSQCPAHMSKYLPEGRKSYEEYEELPMGIVSL